MKYTNRLDFRQLDITYELTDDGIISKGGLLLYKDIISIHLSFKPTKYYGNIYKCAISAKNRFMTLSNRRYISLGNFDYQSELYAQFIQALHVHLSDQKIEFKCGKSKNKYWPEIILVIVTFSILFITISAFATPIVGFIFLVVILYRLIPYYKKNRPGTYAPIDIPTQLLPTS